MMRPDPRIRLADIVEACERIHRFTDGVGEAAFADDEMRVSAVERELIIAGEAVARLVRDSPGLTAWWDTRPEDVIAFRNRAVHGTAAPSVATTFRVAAESAPVLREDAARALGNLESRGADALEHSPGA
jgi:uncharacterized protein with HEPN domain